MRRLVLRLFGELYGGLGLYPQHKRRKAFQFCATRVSFLQKTSREDWIPRRLVRIVNGRQKLTICYLELERTDRVNYGLQTRGVIGKSRL